MAVSIDLNKIYKPSEDVVHRLIEDELIIVPLVAGIADMEDDLFTLNETGRKIWDHLDGKNNVKDIIDIMEEGHTAPKDLIAKDVKGLLSELLKRKIIIEV